MPTGYTAAITEKNITFKEYALSCARAFGALVTMRDDPADAPIPDAFEPESYYINAKHQAEIELQKLEALKPEGRVAFGWQAKVENIARAERSLAVARAENEKYLSMRSQVEAWTPPTSEHEGIKKFMLEQIDISLNDLSYSESSLAAAKEAEPLSLYDSAVAEAKRSIAYGTEENAKEIQRAQSRTDWIKAFKDSLK